MVAKVWSICINKMSNARIKFIIQNASRIKNNKIGINSLDGMNCLDIGCGGDLSES